MEKYNFKEIEKKWQRFWEENGVFKVIKDSSKEKFYLLEMFPYPSGELHMGHMRNYTIGDTLARFLRMKGYNVLYPMGYDALGLPAENAAIKHGVNPREWTYSNIEKMMEQQKKMGLSYDWSRIIKTCDPEYYKWNQWFFLKFYERGLVYKKEAPINWCPSCQTVLANEQVHGGRCWRCGSEVEIRSLSQWFIKITAYAERLYNDIEKLTGWPERVKIMQKNWIGKSVGVRVKFPLIEFDKEIEIFTTRPDTLWGATFLLLSPFHPFIDEVIDKIPNRGEVEDFVKKARIKEKLIKDIEKEKEGVFLSIHAKNPLTGEKIPVYIANFVLMEYGTGAIMSVPAHDQRDFEFARKYNLPIKVVIKPYDGDLKLEEMTSAYEGDGIMVNSGEFSGKDSKIAREKEIPEYLREKGIGYPETQYRLRDWLISRQRYWGTPIPIVYCDNCGVVPLKEKDLPLLLPDDVEFTGKGNPLETSKKFLYTNCPSCGKKAKRETDTMDTFVDSSWYFLRYLDNKNDKEPFSKEEAFYWMPVDQYIGGIEHATMHLIYSRFFYKVLYDMGLVKEDEPFKNLLCQGMVVKDGFKMSKSKGNVVSVDEIVENYGADTGRVFILFASPPEKDLEWSERGVEGSHRFLKRIWNISQENIETVPDEKVEEDMRYYLNYTVKKVTLDIERDFQFNTAIASIMEFLNRVERFKYNLRRDFLNKIIETILLLLYPFAPHITSELWKIRGKGNNIWENRWPEYSEDVIKKRKKTVVIQINGKVRDKIEVSPDISEEDIKKLVYEREQVKKYIKDKEILKEIYIKEKIFSIVVR
ncbi:MAG: leucine--tRNA ligase [Caldiserica bacterium]|nr:MAG: leucine--tRNA ligase [Caldisericota bacterium]